MHMIPMHFREEKPAPSGFVEGGSEPLPISL